MNKFAKADARPAVHPGPKERRAGDGGPSAALVAAERARARPARRDKTPGGIDAALVVARLEEAGRTLLALPDQGWSTRLRTSQLEVVRRPTDAYGWQPGRLRPAAPDSAMVDRMDEALGWLGLIPLERHVLRRIVGARALVSPMTERHLYSWRRLGELLGADHKAVQRWHKEAIALIVAGLQA